MKSRSTTRRATALAVVAALALAVSPAVAGAGRAPSSFVLPLSPVQPSVTCKVAGTTTDSYWFGYTNIAPVSLVAAVGGDPMVAINAFGPFVGDGISNDNGQPDHFKPGTQANAVAITVAKGSTVSWSINADSTTFRSATATTTGNEPTCPTRAVRSANIRVASAAIAWTAGTERRNAAGLLTVATIKFQTTGVQTVCSAGGVPVAPRVLWGFADDFGESPIDGSDGSPIDGGIANYAPISAASIVRVDTFATAGITTGFPGTVNFVRTYNPSRRVANPQSSTTQTLQTWGVKRQFGFSMTVATADVSGACKFGTARVNAPVVWFGGEFSRSVTMSLTDPVAQSSRPPVGCSFTDPAAPCDFIYNVIGPGGMKTTR